jgi:hypothetical protein
MKNILIAVLLLTSTVAFSQQGFRLQPNVKATPTIKDTLKYSVIVYETPKNILKDVIMENEFLKYYLRDKKSVEVLYKKKYTGPANVNNKDKEYIEVLELTIISY